MKISIKQIRKKQEILEEKRNKWHRLVYSFNDVLSTETKKVSELRNEFLANDEYYLSRGLAELEKKIHNLHVDAINLLNQFEPNPDNFLHSDKD